MSWQRNVSWGLEHNISVRKNNLIKVFRRIVLSAPNRMTKIFLDRPKIYTSRPLRRNDQIDISEHFHAPAISAIPPPV
jgi:hypothetical protein